MGYLSGDIYDIFESLTRRCLETARSHGFTDATPGEDIALMHSELSEALEDVRSGRALDLLEYERGAEPRKPIGVPSELADVVIRILHFCGKHKIDLAEAIKAKMAYNESRPYKHGKVL